MRRLLTAIGFLLLSGNLSGQDLDRTVYVDIRPDFVTNFSEGARMKYLRANVSLKIKARDEEAVRYHLPYIKNVLVILFSGQSEENLTSTAGRETLRQVALDSVRQALGKLELDGETKVDDLFFTNFVVQT